MESGYNHNEIPWKPLSTYGIESEQLGSGSFGNVYRIGDKYAVKRFTGGEFAENESSSLIPRDAIREVSILRKICCYNITSFIDVGFSGDEFYMVMPLARTSLEYVIKNEILSFEMKVDYSFRLLKAVSILHNLNVLHGDIKPGNILIFDSDNECNLKLADYGTSVNIYGDNLLTEEKYTLPYRPIEILLNGMYGFSADMWAAGCTIGEIFKGTMIIVSPDSEIDAIFKIFNLLGNPVVNEWPEINDLPGYTDRVKNRKYNASINSTYLNIGDNHQLFDLIIRLLQYNPDKRITAFEAINHEAFSNIIDLRDQAKSPIDKLFMFDEYPDKSQILSRHRLIVINWLFEVYTSRYILDYQTIALSYYLFDTVTSKKIVDRSQLQSYAVMCVQIAVESREEGSFLNFPESYEVPLTSEEILAERQKEILRLVEFKTYITTAADFVNEYSKYYDPKVRILSRFLVMMSYGTDLPFLYEPSLIAKYFLEVSRIILNDAKADLSRIKQLYEITNLLRIMNDKYIDLLMLKQVGYKISNIINILAEYSKK